MGVKADRFVQNGTTGCCACLHSSMGEQASRKRPICVQLTVKAQVFQRGNDMEPVTAQKNLVGRGWHELLDRMHQELILIDPEYRVAQVKEKWGDLRVYVDVSDPAKLHTVYDVINKYEKMSATTCENCGHPGKKTNTFWRRTLCASCTRDWLHDRKFRDG